MASSYVPGLTPTFRTPAASSYVPGLTPSLQPAASSSGLSPEALQKLQAEMAAWDPKTMVAPGNFAVQPSASQQRVDAYIAEQGKQGNELMYRPTGMNPWGNAIGMGGATNYDEFDPNNPSATMLPVFHFDPGNRGSAPVVLKPGEVFTLKDWNGRPIATANTPEQMRALIALSDKQGSSGWKLFSNRNAYGTASSSPEAPDDSRLVHSREPKDNTLLYVIGAGLAAMTGGAALGIGAGGAGGAGGLGSITGASAANAVLPGLASSVVPVSGAGLTAAGAVLPSVAGISGAGAAGAAGGLGSITGASAAAATLPGLAGTVVPVAGGVGGGGLAGLSAAGLGSTFGVAPITVIGAGGLTAAELAALGGAATTAGSTALASNTAASGGTPVQYNPVTNEIVVTAPKPPVLPPPPVTALPPLPPITPTTASPPTVDVPKLETEVNSGLSTMDKIRLGLLGAGLISDVAEGGGSGGTIPGGLGGGRSPIFTAKLPPPNMPIGTPRQTSDIDYYRYGYGPEQSFFSNVPKGEPNTSRAYTGYEEREGFAQGGQPTPRGVLPMVEGNIDLHNRPVVRNEDGTISTVKTRSFNFDVGEVLLPTVSEDGRVMSDDEAVDQFRRTGRHLGVFTTPEEATEYAQRLHEDQEREYAPRSNFAVGGPGDGRDDEIPAMLSDGEYVIDAETVALLGNGSNKAGAKALDSFRVNVRKHKGGKLAKGAFSADAKRPEQYLKGRK